jgi:hypothetical protein
MQQANIASCAGSEAVGTSVADANTHAVCQAFRAWNADHFEALSELLHPEIGWYTPGKSAFAGDTLGRQAVLEKFAQYASATQGTFRASLKKILHSEDGRIVAIHHDTAERNHKRLAVGCCTVFDFEDGLILESRDHFYDLYRWDEFWS